MQKHAAERNQILRDEWILKLAGWDASQLLFLDESAANERTMDRKYGWAPIGVTPHEYKSIKRSERWSILPVYTVDGFYVWDIIQGSYTNRKVVNPSSLHCRWFLCLGYHSGIIHKGIV